MRAWPSAQAAVKSHPSASLLRFPPPEQDRFACSLVLMPQDSYVCLFFLHVPASAGPFPAELHDPTCLLKTGLQMLPLR